MNECFFLNQGAAAPGPPLLFSFSFLRGCRPHPRWLRLFTVFPGWSMFKFLSSLVYHAFFYHIFLLLLSLLNHRHRSKRANMHLCTTSDVEYKVNSYKSSSPIAAQPQAQIKKSKYALMHYI